MLTQLIKLQIIIKDGRRITKPLFGAITCPKCGSAEVELTPAIFVRSKRYANSGNTPAYQKCSSCGDVSKLTAEAQIRLAEYVLEDKAGWFTVAEKSAARDILDQAAAGEL